VRALHRELLRADPFARFPLAEITAMNGGREPFFATFNFLHFRQWAGRDTAPGVRVATVHSLDRLHLPLNLAVSLAPHGDGGDLLARYDGRYFAADEIAAALDGYLQRLADAAALRG
jgi:hypothetical protein